MLVLAASLVLVGCEIPRTGNFPSPTQAPISLVQESKYRLGVPDAQSNPEARRVLVVVNRASETSFQIAEYYGQKRKIPESNFVKINVADQEVTNGQDFKLRILAPVKAALGNAKNRIDFIVTTKGVPIRIGGGNGYSVDAHLMAMDKGFEPIPETIVSLSPEQREAAIVRSLNPYQNAKEPFNSKKYGMWLVTRLDGYELPQIKKLIDNSVAAKRETGPFFFDAAGNRNSEGYKITQDSLRRAHATLTRRGFNSELEDTQAFVNPRKPLAGYASWGSNDGAFNAGTYYGLRFKPGAIAETFVSTSGRTFSRTSGGQSLIADLIEQGITGVKGYVSEPYTFALADAEVLFDRYTSGFNLAESFYAASLVIKWKDVVIGDPLCRPYAK